MQFCKLELYCHVLLKEKKFPPGDTSKQSILVQSFSNRIIMNLTLTMLRHVQSEVLPFCFEVSLNIVRPWPWGEFAGISTPANGFECFSPVEYSFSLYNDGFQITSSNFADWWAASVASLRWFLMHFLFNVVLIHNSTLQTCKLSELQLL